MESLMITQDYLQAVKALKDAITQSRYRAIQHANKEVLYLNYAIGRFISINSRSAKWGSNAIKIISELLQKEMPGLRGYSESNIKMMRTFYEEWKDVFENRQLPIDDFYTLNISELENRQLTTGENYANLISGSPNATESCVNERKVKFGKPVIQRETIASLFPIFCARSR